VTALELETFFRVSEQLKLFLISCLFGIPIGIVYDIFRIIRITLPHNTLLVAIEDILFFIMYSIFLMAFTIAAARADFRVYYILGNLLGFTVYFFSVGNIVTGVFIKIMSFLKRFIIKPITFTIKKLCIVKKY